MALLRAAFLSYLFALAAVVPASALEVGSSGGELRVVAGPGERNALTLSSTNDDFVIRSDGAVPVEGPGCTRSSGIVRCSRVRVHVIAVEMGDRDDVLSIALPVSKDMIPVSVGGGVGADAVKYGVGGGPVSVTLDGQSNDGPGGRGDNVHADVERVDGTGEGDTLTGSTLGDRLAGLAGRDALSGGDGNDFIDSREWVSCSGAPEQACQAGEPDYISCGPGSDTVDGDRADHIAADCELVAREDQVTLTPGEDHVRGWRRGLYLTGGKGDDRITGRGHDFIGGNSGDDVLRAGPRGFTSLVGGSGNDLLVSSEPSAYLAGGYGRDRLIAGNGNDFVWGGAGRDVLFGGLGDDRMVSRERGSETDRVRCGAGRDTVIADRHDVIDRRSCERVQRG